MISYKSQSPNASGSPSNLEDQLDLLSLVTEAERHIEELYNQRYLVISRGQWISIGLWSFLLSTDADNAIPRVDVWLGDRSLAGVRVSSQGFGRSWVGGESAEL